MKRLTYLVQRSPEWFELRKTRIFASEIATAMNKNPWESSYSLWLTKIGMGKTKITTEAMQKGIDNEPIALSLFNEKIGYEFNPVVGLSDEFEFLGASFDGYCDRDEIVEIKCSEKCFNEAKKGLIHEIYHIQMQGQMIVSNAKKCHFCAYHDGQIEHMEIASDILLQQKIIAECGKFWRENVLGFTPPPMGKGDFEEREDIEWARASMRWKAIQVKKKEIEQEEAECRKWLTDLSNGNNCKGCGVTLSTHVRRGTIDYASLDVVKSLLPEVLEEHRKNTTKVTTIRSE